MKSHTTRCITQNDLHFMSHALQPMLFFCFLLMMPYFLLYANPPDTIWSRAYGGANIDVAYSVCQTADGRYVATGYTNSFGAGQQDAYLVRINDNGDTLWTRTFGGASMDGAHFVHEASDHGYVIAGYTESYGGGKNMYLIKTDSIGQAEWTRVYGTAMMDVAYGFCETPDSGYMFVGYKNGPAGWTKGDLWILKTDETLDTVWTKAYGGAGEDYGVSIQLTPDAGYIITGSTTSFGAGGKDLWLVKIDAYGDTMWTKTYGNSLEDVGYGVNLTADNGYIVTGYVNGTGPWTAGDLWLLKTDSIGDTLWAKIYGVSGEDFGFNVYETPDHGYVTAGQSSQDMWLMRTDSLGDTLWTKKYGGSGSEAALALAITSDGGYVIGGYTTSFGHGAHDFWIIRTEPDVGIMENHSDINKQDRMSAAIISGHQVFPNFKHYKIYDICGRMVTPGDLSPGVYFIASRSKILRKVVKVR